jgi:tetratricopeptide (TPR) repeat protein
VDDSVMACLGWAVLLGGPPLIGIIIPEMLVWTGRWLPSVDAWSRLDAWLVRRSGLRYFWREVEQHPRESPEEIALRAYEQALLARPNDWRILNVFVGRLLLAYRYRAALEAAERLHELRPRHVRSSYVLAQVYIALSDAAMSEDELKSVRAADGPKAVLEWGKRIKAARRGFGLHLLRRPAKRLIGSIVASSSGRMARARTRSGERSGC